MFEFVSKVRYSETDSEGKLSLPALLDYFQDSSTFQSEELELGIEYTKELNLAWVMSYWQIEVERYPKLCEDITIGTFPYEFKSCMGGRNFYLKDGSGNRIAAANSIWALMNIKEGRPSIPTDKMLETYVLEEKLDMEYAPRKIRIPDEEGVYGEDIVVGVHHLDTNHHVNNGQYIRMAMNYIPEGTEVARLRAEYKQQAFLKDVIRPYIIEKDGTYWVCLRDTEGKSYVNVEFVTR